MSLEGRWPQADKIPAAKSLYRSIVLDNGIWHMHSIRLIFLYDAHLLRAREVVTGY